MKMKYLTMAVLCAALLVGCSKENEPENNDVTISRIYASDENSPETRTILDGYSVTWVNGDVLGCIKTTDPASNSKFVLTNGSGTKSGTFDAASEADKLTRDTWIAYYPYSAAKYTSTKKFTMVNQTQTDETTKHIANTDWLISKPVKVGLSNLGTDFKMQHIFALVEFRVKLKEPAESEYDEPRLAQCVLGTQGGSRIFAQRIYFDDKGAIQFDYTAANTAIVRSDKPLLTNTNYITAWLLTRQSSLQPLTVTVFFEYGVITSAATQFTPTSILEPGKKYEIELELDINENNPNSSTLTIVGRS